MLVVTRAGNPDTWAENDGRSPTIALAQFISKSISNPIRHGQRPKN
jgi:hypothetical protein